MGRRSTLHRTASLLMMGLWLSLPVGMIEAAEPVGPNFSIPNSAHARAVMEDDHPQLEARLLVARDSSRDSMPTQIGVLFDLAEGWHIYWRNPGGTGIAPSLGLTIESEQVSHRIGEVTWPPPQIFREADGLFTTYGYERSVMLVAPIEPIAVGRSNSVARADEIRADATVLICRTQCVPASFSLSTPLNVQVPADEQVRINSLFDRTNASIPVSAKSLGFEIEAVWSQAAPAMDETASLEVIVESCRDSGHDCHDPVTDADGAVFIPLESDTFELDGATLNVPSGEPRTGHFSISLEATRLEPGSDRLRGLLRVRALDGVPRYVSVDIPIATSADAFAVPASTASSSSPASSGDVAATPIAPQRWIQIFFLALLGGLILNAMPCVLPVLAIKVFAIADLAEKDPKEVQLHGLAYTGGVLLSMAALAAVVIGLRRAGHSVGWGFQFQEPIFVAAISALLVAFALNLFGVFEIEFGQGRLASVGQNASGLKRSAFEGLLAVILATPCTAPFLGTAVGFAFATSGFGIAAIFLAIGLGLASPFLIVSFVPGLARFIPKSGPWMMKLRAGLGFSLLATAVWLLWVLGQSGGVNVVVVMIGNLLFLAFLLWGFGQVQPIQRTWVGRAAAILIVSLAFTGFNLIDFDRTDPGEIDSATSESQWRPYSEAAVADALAEGQSAFVVFTADWCITCQVNKHTVLERKAVRDAFAESGFALFEADWTKRDEAIRLKLAEFGRAGVPLYVVYSPDEPDRPQILSELLSQQEVIAALSIRPRLAGDRG